MCADSRGIVEEDLQKNVSRETSEEQRFLAFAERASHESRGLTRENVSRETFSSVSDSFLKLKTYAEILKKWQKRINLVADSTIENLWERHMLDSVQILPLLPAGPLKILDLGSGAGFPGMVLKLMRPELELFSIESDTKKCSFLEEVARQTKTKVTVYNKRIEKVDPFKVNVVISRALAGLSVLLGYALPFMSAESICFFHKGKSAEEEIREAEKKWHFSCSRHKSQIDENGVILEIKGVSSQ